MRFKIVSNDELSSLGSDMGSILDEYGNSIIEILEDGTVNWIGSDGGEPEDQFLTRDWSWVVGALNKAYEDGKNSK